MRTLYSHTLSHHRPYTGAHDSIADSCAHASTDTTTNCSCESTDPNHSYASTNAVSHTDAHANALPSWQVLVS